MHKLCPRRSPAPPSSLPCQLSFLWQQPQAPQPWSLPPSKPLPAGSMLMEALPPPLSLLLTPMYPSLGTMVVSCCTYPFCGCMPASSCDVHSVDCCIILALSCSPGQCMHTYMWLCLCTHSMCVHYITYTNTCSTECPPFQVLHAKDTHSSTHLFKFVILLISSFGSISNGLLNTRGCKLHACSIASQQRQPVYMQAHRVIHILVSDVTHVLVPHMQVCREAQAVAEHLVAAELQLAARVPQSPPEGAPPHRIRQQALLLPGTHPLHWG